MRMESGSATGASWCDVQIISRRMAEAAAFTIYASATAGQAPHELSYLGALLGHAVGRPVETTADFRALMQHLKIGRAKGRWQNWSWEPNARDQAVMADLLYRGRRAIGLRRRPGGRGPQAYCGFRPVRSATRAMVSVCWSM